MEGNPLRKAGFVPNRRYRVKYTENGMELRVSNKGERFVSKRTRSNEVYPIIDINNQRVLEIFEEGTPIKCSVEKGVIKISIHKIRELQLQREERLLDRLASGKKLKESALFVGGGISTHGIHAGLKKAKVSAKIDSLAELDSSYLQIAQRNLNPVHSYKGAIEEIEGTDIREADILSFSMPCTGHSTHGKASKKLRLAEEHDKANTALFGVVNYIVQSNPSVLISENVVGARNSATYILLRAELSRIGYTVKEFELDHNQAGSVEKIKRYWFVAVSAGLDKKLPIKNLEVPNYKKKFKNIKSLIAER